MGLQQAIAVVSKGQAQRICAPGEWIVWREDGIVRHKTLNSNSMKANN